MGGVGVVGDIDEWRERVVTWITAFTLVFGAPAVGAIIMFTADAGQNWSAWPFMVGYVAYIPLILLRHRLSWRPRAIVYLVILNLFGAYVLAEWGIQGAGRMVFMASICLGAVLLGLRGGLVCLGVALSLIAVFGSAHVRGILTAVPLEDSTLSSAWWYLGAGILVLGGSVTLAGGTLTQALSRSLARTQQLVTDLTAKVGDLERRDASLHVLADTAASLVGAGNWEKDAPELVRRLAATMHVRRVEIGRYEMDEGTVVWTTPFVWDSVRGTDAFVVRGRTPIGPELEPYLERLAAGQVLHMRVPDVVPEVAALLEQYGTPSSTVFPILVERDLWGYVGFGCEEGQQLSEGDANLVRTLADNLGAGIASERLHSELEQRVAARTSELREANEELESFTQYVSHDLRAPLRHIGGFVELLRHREGERLDPESARFLQTITQSTTRMGDLLDDLLSFARLGRQALTPTRVDLRQMVASVQGELAEEMKPREIEWRVGDCGHIWGDPTLLAQALRNLIGNAVKYSSKRDAATVEIGCRTEGNERVLWVRDNGVGFDMRYADKLFQVFQRLHTGNEFPGTGIGLAHVRRIAERHGGRVWAEGESDRGATFYLALPEPAATTSRGEPRPVAVRSSVTARFSLVSPWHTGCNCGVHGEGEMSAVQRGGILRP